MTRRQLLAALIGLSSASTAQALAAQTQPRFAVIGAVASPGSFNYEEGITVGQAIATAGGLTPYGSPRRIRIRREVDGKTADIGVTMTDIVRPNDTVVVARRFYH